MTRFLLLTPLLLAATAALPIQPGKWVTTVTILDVTMPGAPPQVAAMMKGRPTTVIACLTTADAANGPRALAEKSNGRCRYTEFDMTGGAIRSTMSCQGGMTAHSTGSYTPTSMTLDGAVTGERGLTMKTHTVGRRIGGC